MNGFSFQKPELLILLALAPAYAALLVARTALIRRDIERFSGTILGKISPKQALESLRGLDKLKIILLMFAVASIVLALARPVWGVGVKKLAREGHDVVFLLDVSNSMSARDLVPNRLERCKLWIKDCLAGFKDHRVALVVFAGSASIKSPLTKDYAFIRSALSKADRWSVAQGGTRIGDALIKTCDKLFADKKSGARDIILLTDGGTFEKDLSKAIKSVNDKNAQLIVIGVGATTKGARIPSPDGKGYMRYNGEYVSSRMQTAVLRSIIRKCRDGAYIPAGTGNMDLSDIYRRLSERRASDTMGSEEIAVPNEIFQVFIALALLALGALAALPPAPRRKRQTPKRSTAKYAAAFLLLGFSATSAKCDTEPPSPPALYNLANKLYRARDYERAVKYYREALDGIPNVEARNSREWKKLCAKINYNLATASLLMTDFMPPVAKLRLRRVAIAVDIYRRLIADGSPPEGTSRNLEIALAKFAEIKKSMDEAAAKNKTKGKNGKQEDSDDEEEQNADQNQQAEEDSSKQQRQPSARVVDQENRNIPPPNESPDDIMKMEDALMKRRKSANKNKQKGRTEMDW